MKHITRLEDHNSIDQQCDRENLLTDLPESSPYKEPLHNKSGLISYGDICQYVHQEFYILPRPLKAMTEWKFQHMQKEGYILSRPLKLQPVANYSIASLSHDTEGSTPTAEHSRSPGDVPVYTQRTLYSFRFRTQTGETNISSTLVQHRQNTSWEPATVMSQCTSNSYWIMQENGTDQPKVYRSDAPLQTLDRQGTETAN